LEKSAESHGSLQKPRTLKRDFKEKRPDEWTDNRKPNQEGDGYQEMPTTNEDFVQYYQKQVGLSMLFATLEHSGHIMVNLFDGFPF